MYECSRQELAAQCRPTFSEATYIETAPTEESQHFYYRLLLIQRPLMARTMSDNKVPEKVVPQSNASSVESTGPNGHGILSYQSNADGALQMLEAGSLRSIDPETSKSLLRRIDIYIMPLICMYVNPTILATFAG